MMPIPKDKVKFSLWVHPQTPDKVEANYKKENSISRSDFIEKAIEFYCEYLASEDYEKYFGKKVITKYFCWNFRQACAVEILGLKWSDLNLTNGSLQIARQNAKKSYPS